MTIRERQFAASLEGGGSPEPRDDLPPDVIATWREVVQAVPDGVLCPSDRGMVECAAGVLVIWRRQLELNRLLGPNDAPLLPTLRYAYRVLGELLMPMRERRRLLFPDRPPRRELA